MEHTVSHCGYLTGILDNAVNRVYQRVHNHLDGCGMVRHWIFYHMLVLAFRLVGQLGALDTDSLTETFCQYTLVLHIN